MPVQTCKIKSGTSLFFPFLLGWCDTASKGFYGKTSYPELLDCALKSDKGIITMEALLDKSKIIDIQVDNTDFNKSRILNPNLAVKENYHEIITPSLFNLTISKNTRMPSDSYEHPEEFESKPVIYKAAAQCFCGYVGNLTAGNHELVYKTTIKGSQGTSGGSQDQITTIVYNLNVQ